MNTPAMSKADALATIAYVTLAARGRHFAPTMHEVSMAIAQASPLLDLDYGEGVAVQSAALRQLVERHGWPDENVLILDPATRRKR